MTVCELCDRLSVAEEVKEKVAAIDRTYRHEALSAQWEKLYSPETWDEGVKELQAALGEDPDGMKILTCMLHCCLKTREMYAEKGISEEVFYATMRFIPRFLEWQKKYYGTYAFTWAWWFPRQLSMREFRIGELEFEMTQEKGEPVVSLHIPAGVSLRRESLRATYAAWKAFAAEFYPDYADVPAVCDSWLLSPALKELLPPDSPILYFQSCFKILHSDRNDAVVDWVFPGKRVPYAELAEGTSLQRAMKRYLLAGGTVGWTAGRLRSFE